MNQIHIPTFIIHLEKRIDRREHILKEFAGHNEFSINIIEPIPHAIGAVSLWCTIKHIIQNLTKNNEDYVLICEDDHQFTDSYSKELLYTCIGEAMSKEADVLLGGVHWFNSGLQISDDLFWVDRFTGAQFTIIFRNFFKTILEADFDSHDVADLKISDLTKKKFFIGPFISVQKDFGYSDATPKNNEEGKMEKLFSKASASVQTLQDVAAFYEKRKANQESEKDFDNLTIPTYIISPPGIPGNQNYIGREFKYRTEFDINLVENCKHEISSVSLWLTIRKIVEIAIENEDDVIIICENDHEFTEHYTKEFLIENIIEAHEQGVEMILGSVYSFGLVVPITRSRYWVNHFYGARFIILYRPVFKKILNEPFDDNLKIDFILSDVTSSKNLIYPFISKQRLFDNDSFIAVHDDSGELIVSLLEDANVKLEKVYESANVYGA